MHSRYSRVSRRDSHRQCEVSDSTPRLRHTWCKTPGQVQFAPYYYMDGVGGWNQSQSNGIVVITFPGYTPLYTATVEDYNWEKVFAGAYISEQLGTTTEGVTLYKGVAKADVEAENPGCYDRFAELYGTPYLIKDAYAEGYDIVFGVKDGEVKVIEGYESQPLGIQAVGADVYGAIGTGVYTYGVEALSQTGGSYYEGSENATLFQCNELPCAALYEKFSEKNC